MTKYQGKFIEVKLIAIKQYTMRGEGVAPRRPWEVEMTKYHGEFGEIKITAVKQ